MLVKYMIYGIIFLYMSELAPQIESSQTGLKFFDEALESLRPYLDSEDTIDLQFTPATKINYKGKPGSLRFFVYEPGSEDSQYSASIFAEIIHPGAKRDIIRVQRERLNPESIYYRSEPAEVQKIQRKIYSLKNLVESFDNQLGQSVR